MEVRTNPELSHSSDLLLRWLAILSGTAHGSLAVTGGLHTARNAIQAVLCGAHARGTAMKLLQTYRVE